MTGLLSPSPTTWAANLMSGGLKPGLVSRSAQDANTSTNATSDFIDELEFSASKSIRTSIITLASFNVLAAAVTLVCVVWDCYSGAKRKNPNLALRDLRPSFVCSYQVYPLVLCLGIIAQGIIFAVAQARGLEALLVKGCAPVSQMMMPATFLVPFIQLAFSIETTLRSFPRNQFPERRNWVVLVCVGVVIAGLVALYAVTLSLPPPDLCFASLFWFTQQWRPVCFGLFVGITIALLFCLLAVYFRLRHGRVSSSLERTAASHMVYYMGIAIFSNALLIPFFLSITFGDQDDSASSPMELSTVSSIVANLSGLMTGALYLFLRGRSASPVGSSKHETYDFDSKYFGKAAEKRISEHGAGQDYTVRISSPSIYSQADDGTHWLQLKSEEANVQGFMGSSKAEKGIPLGVDSRPTPMQPPTKTTPIEGSSNRDTEAHTTGRPCRSSTERSPAAANDSPSILPSTTYAPISAIPAPGSTLDILLVPPPLFHEPSGGRHRRNSSTGSSETVQIGLRISNMNDVRPMRPSQLRSSRPTQELRSPTSTSAFSPHDPNLALNSTSHVKQKSTGSIELNKELPEVPPESPARQEGQGEVTKLSPTVYDPQKQPPRARLASPKGVGFQTAPVDRTPRRGAQLNPSTNAATETGGWI